MTKIRNRSKLSELTGANRDGQLFLNIRSAIWQRKDMRLILAPGEYHDAF